MLEIEFCVFSLLGFSLSWVQFFLTALSPCYFALNHYVLEVCNSLFLFYRSSQLRDCLEPWVWVETLAKTSNNVRMWRPQKPMVWSSAPFILTNHEPLVVWVKCCSVNLSPWLMFWCLFPTWWWCCGRMNFRILARRSVSLGGSLWRLYPPTVQDYLVSQTAALSKFRLYLLTADHHSWACGLLAFPPRRGWGGSWDPYLNILPTFSEKG